jgi:hypothetical protein
MDDPEYSEAMIMQSLFALRVSHSKLGNRRRFAFDILFGWVVIPSMGAKLLI